MPLSEHFLPPGQKHHPSTILFASNPILFRKLSNLNQKNFYISLCVFVVIFPGQTHPEQYHLKKTETFHVLDGDVKLKLNKKKHNMKKGDIITINPKTKHEFSSKNGAVIEEISSTHYKSDSFYTDKKIKNNLNRKTKINYYWI